MEIIDFNSQINKNAKRAIIFVHGWKGNKDSFISLPNMLNLESTSWYFPEAPYIIDNDDKTRSWSYQKEDGSFEVEKSKLLFNDFLINNILNQFDSKDVFFIGFSQGATVCYEFVLGLDQPWGGIFPVAGFFRDWNEGINIHPCQNNIKILIGHGINDAIINIEESEKIYDYLLKRNYNCKLIKYKGGHKISLDYLKKIKEHILDKG